MGTSSESELECDRAECSADFFVDAGRDDGDDGDNGDELSLLEDESLLSPLSLSESALDALPSSDLRLLEAALCAFDGRGRRSLQNSGSDCSAASRLRRSSRHSFSFAAYAVPSSAMSGPRLKGLSASSGALPKHS